MECCHECGRNRMALYVRPEELDRLLCWRCYQKLRRPEQQPRLLPARETDSPDEGNCYCPNCSAILRCPVLRDEREE